MLPGADLNGKQPLGTLNFLLRMDRTEYAYDSEFRRFDQPCDGHFWIIRETAPGNGVRSAPARP